MQRIDFLALPAAVVISMCSVLPPARAADHMNLDEGLPVTIEDAFPIPYRQREVQALGQYENVRDDPKGE